MPATSPSTISDAAGRSSRSASAFGSPPTTTSPAGRTAASSGRVEDDGVLDVGHGAVERADPVRRVEVRGVDPAVDDRVRERGVRGGDERGVGAAVRVGEAGEQVRGVAGVGDGQLGAHPGGGEHGVVGGARARSGSRPRDGSGS